LNSSLQTRVQVVCARGAACGTDKNADARRMLMKAARCRREVVRFLSLMKPPPASEAARRRRGGSRRDLFWLAVDLRV
jgi:hypothetical protein